MLLVEEHKSSRIKVEEYEPSEELRQTMATLPSQRIATPAIKREPSKLHNYSQPLSISDMYCA